MSIMSGRKQALLSHRSTVKHPALGGQAGVPVLVAYAQTSSGQTKTQTTEDTDRHDERPAKEMIGSRNVESAGRRAVGTREMRGEHMKGRGGRRCAIHSLGRCCPQLH